MTWMQPRRTNSLGERACTSSPSNYDGALGHLAALGDSRLEIAFNVVDLPAPLAPSSATISPRDRERHAL